MKAILVERHGRVGLVTLNRPEKLNALSSALVNQLELALRELNADDDIGAIVITGAGAPAVSAGAALGEPGWGRRRARGSPAGARSAPRRARACTRAPGRA